MNEIKYVLFDLDGVLVDACEWHFDSLNMALKKVAGFEISRQDHEQKYNGLPTKIKLELLNITGDKAEQINNLKQKFTVDLINDNLKLDREKVDLLSYLKKKNVSIACVTNSIRKNTELMLRVSGQLPFIDQIVSNEDVLKNKPDPECYNLAMKKMSADPNLTLCVEDSPKGIEAAESSFAKNLWKVENSSQVTLENYKRLWI